MPALRREDRHEEGQVFYSCERYPECQFSSWDVPTNEKCPKCGGMLNKKKGKNLHICKNENCDYKREIEPEPETETTEDITGWNR